jgi:RNA polymerase sigma-70 factor (ECF subfamily)
MKKHTKEAATTTTTKTTTTHATAMLVDYSSHSDEALLMEYRTTEDAAVFTELVSRYQSQLFNYLRRFLGGNAKAEDVFQQTFLQVHVKCGLFQEGRKFRPWLYTIATHQAIDYQRRNRRHRRLSLDQSRGSGGEEVGSLMEIVTSQDAGPGAKAESTERAEWVRSAVSNLPESLQAAVQLVYFRGMKYGEAAKLLSVPVGTVKSRLHSARKSLGQLWREGHTANQP